MTLAAKGRIAGSPPIVFCKKDLTKEMLANCDFPPLLLVPIEIRIELTCIKDSLDLQTDCLCKWS